MAVREIPRRGARAGDADEVGRRSDGDRANVQTGAGERDSLAGNGQVVRGGSSGRAPDREESDYSESGSSRLYPLRVRAGLHGGAGAGDDADRSLVPAAGL